MSAFQFQASNVMARLKPFGILFEKSLSDLIKGIRANSKDSPESLLKFLDNAIVECKDELNTTDLETKAMAILKLAYLEMYGFEMSWCNFHILEVMSSNKFQQKRIGYLAAIQSFKNEEDLLILATNQFKKDLNSHNHVEIGLALSGIATIVTPNLSKDINDDVLMKLSHSKPYIRKKAILAMYKIFLQYPESLRINFNRVIEKLDDDDASVVSATINVICEISKKNPKIFVNYLPKFFKILEDTRNNWLIIRILKLFQSLSKVEPRMKKKILPTIIDLMLKTEASSLIYECINCIINGAMLSPDSPKDKEVARLCIEQIMKFFANKDSNLKFVGLLALINTVQVFPTLISKVKGVSSIIMECLTDNDLIIKRKALEICQYLINEDNIVELIKVLLVQLVPKDDVVLPDGMKEEICTKIFQVGSANNYANIPNFKWYITVLKDVIHLVLLPLKSSNSPALSQDINKSISVAIGKEFKSIVTKVPSIRPNVLSLVVDMITNVDVIEYCPLLLRDFFWILGEFVDELKVKSDDADDDSDEEDDYTDEETEILSLGKKIEIFNCLLNEQVDKELGTHNFEISTKLANHTEGVILVVAVQTVVKIFSNIVTDYASIYSVDNKLDADKFNDLTYYLYKCVQFLTNWEIHSYYEVQERTLSWLEFLKICLEAMVDGDFSVVDDLKKKELEHFKTLAAKPAKNSSEEGSSSSEEEESDEDEESEEDEETHDYIDLSSEEEPEVENIGDGESFKDEGDVSQEEGAVSQDEERPDEEFGGEKEVYTTPKQLPMLLTHILPSFFKSYPLNPVAKNHQRKLIKPEDLDLETQINYPQIEVLSEEDDDLFSEDDEDDTTNLIDIDPVVETQQKQDRIERLKDDPYYLDSDIASKPKKVKKLIDDDRSETSSVSPPPVSTKSKKPKAKKLKKEKVLILAEEGSDDDAVLESKKIPKKKKNLLQIDSSNLDNFDLNSEPSDANTLSNVEYNIDLEAIRKSLAESSLDNKKKTKDKHKSKKPKKSTKKEKVAKEEPKDKEKTKEDTVDDTINGKTDRTESPVPIAIKKTKTKKKKAVIQE